MAAALGIGLIMMACAGAWVWSSHSDLPSLYTVTAAGPLDHVAFSPNGQVVATAAANGTIELWRAADGSPLHSLRSHVGPAAIAFYPDNTKLVSAGEDSTVRLWQVATGQSLTTLWPPTLVKPAPTAEALTRQIRADVPFSAVTFSPDGQLIAVGTWYGWVIIFEAATGQVVNVVQAYPELTERPPQRMEFIAVSPNNQWLITTALKSLKLWRLPDRRLIQDFSFEQIRNVPFYAQRGAFTADSAQVWLFDDGGRQSMPRR
jgi:WD40 repeat protein